MPDSYGLPTEWECIRKLDIVLPDAAEADLLSDVQPILSAVIAELESPVGRNNSGGTGRRFRSVTETRTFDGNGLPTLAVDDIVPNTTLTVTVYGTPLLNVIATEARAGFGYNRVLRAADSTPYLTPDYPLSVWPLGNANISITTTWGYSATVPVDIYEAVRCEVCYRAIVQGVVPLAGIGDDLKLSEFEYNSSSGISVWEKSSPIAIFHKIWTDTLNRYRDTGSWRRARLYTGIA